MGTTLKPLYGSHTALTTTSLHSQGNRSYVGSAAIDNTSNLWDRGKPRGNASRHVPNDPENTHG
jgi:hypothetical protein